MINRTNTRTIKVGNIEMGGNENVIIQSMCNTKTKDVEQTVKQILELENAGCQIIRVACLDIEDAKSIAEKVSLVKKYNLGGVAEWTKDRETDDVWHVINEGLNE